MTKVKWSGSIVWLCTSLTLGCIGPFPDEGDEEAGDESPTAGETGGSEVSGPITVSGPWDDTGGWTMGSTDSMGSTDPWPEPSASATSVSGTATCGDCTESTTSTTGGEDSPQVCGVEIEHDPYWDNTYICGCEACNVQFDNVVPASGEALLAECECICYEVGCGGSVSGGATSGIPDEDTGWGTEDTGGTFGSTDPDSVTEPTTASSEDSGQGSDDTDPTG